MNSIDKLEEQIKQTLYCEKASYESCGSYDDVIKGWIEALEYVLREINLNKCDNSVTVEEQADAENVSEETILAKKVSRLKEMGYKISKEGEL